MGQLKENLIISVQSSISSLRKQRPFYYYYVKIISCPRCWQIVSFFSENQEYSFIKSAVKYCIIYFKRFKFIIYLLKGNQLRMLRYLGHFVFIFILWVVCCYKKHWSNVVGVNIELSSSSAKPMQVKTLLPLFCVMTKLGYSPWK